MLKNASFCKTVRILVKNYENREKSSNFVGVNKDQLDV